MNPLLRYITPLSPPSQYPSTLSVALLTGTHAPTEFRWGKKARGTQRRSGEYAYIVGHRKGEWDKLEDVAEVMDGTMKLWVASVPQRYSGEVTGKEGPRLESPPFLLPFSTLSPLAAKLVSHSIWQHCSSHTHITRKLRDLLTTYLFLSLSLPSISSSLWVAQALCVNEGMRKQRMEFFSEL